MGEKFKNLKSEFLSFVRGRPPCEAIDHHSSTIRDSSSWCGCAVGEYFTQIYGGDRQVDDAFVQKMYDVIPADIMLMLNRCGPETYGDLADLLAEHYDEAPDSEASGIDP